MSEFPSRRFKTSFQTALAMVLAYGFALSQDWDKPMWAAFAVAFISMSTADESLFKGAQRMLGTLAAAVVSLTIIGLCAQDRWLFMVMLSSWIGFSTYQMSGSRYPYFWFCCGFVAAIIAMDTGPNALNAFATAVLRTLETGLGILVYSLVALLVWPKHEEKEADAQSQDSRPPEATRVGAALKVMIIYWTGYLAVIYIPDFPGGIGFLAMTAPIAMTLANTPQLRPQAVFIPAATSLAFAGFAYMLLLPKLSSFTQLAPVLFGFTLAICYLFYSPQKMLGRAFGLALFFATTSIQNEQTYSFLAWANTSLMFALLCVLLVMADDLPWSTRPAAAQPG
ncbi:MAG: FUSC family protein [Halieaceae bacterium]